MKIFLRIYFICEYLRETFSAEKRRTYSIVCCLFPLLLACSSGQPTEEKKEIPPPAPQPKENLKTGEILQLKCKGDTAQSFALYLPAKYASDKNLPVIFFFDPHAKGSLPLELYKDLGEKYSCILLGSNSSKNGNTQQRSDEIINTLLSEAADRLNFDSKKMYTAGFSGGARVASSAAIFSGKIRATILCGGGFPQLKSDIRNKFDLIGFAGNEDFNLTELMNLDTAVSQSDIRHHLIVFDGKHDWPKKEVMEDGFLFLRFNEMKDGLAAKDDSLVKDFVLKNEKDISAIKRKTELFERYKKLVILLDGLADVSKYKKEMETILASSEYKQQAAELKQVREAEMQAMQSYSQLMQTQKEEGWWASEVKKLGAKGRTGEETHSRKRILAYLSLVAYSYSNSALQQNNLQAAGHYLSLYRIIDPSNPEHEYMMALMKARQGDNKGAIQFLEEAVKLGFEEFDRMKAEPDFAGIRQEKDFTGLTQTGKARSK